MGNRLKAALTLLCVLALTGIMCRLPWEEIFATLCQVSFGWIALSLGIGAAGITLRALRLKTVLGPEATFGRVWVSAALGYLTSLVIPFGGGEAAKAITLARAAGLPLARTLSAVSLDRLFDLGTLAVLAAATLAFHAAPTLRSGPLLTVCAVFALGLLSASLSVLQKEKVGQWLDALPLPPAGKGKLRAAYGHWHEQALRLRQNGIWPKLGAIQATVLASDLIATWCGLHAVPATASLGIAAALQLNLFVMLAFALPLLPGSLGTLQAAYTLALGPFGVGAAVSIAIGLIGQVGHTVLVGTLGLVALLLLHRGLRGTPVQGQIES